MEKKLLSTKDCSFSERDDSELFFFDVSGNLIPKTLNSKKSRHSKEYVTDKQRGTVNDNEHVNDINVMKVKKKKKGKRKRKSGSETTEKIINDNSSQNFKNKGNKVFLKENININAVNIKKKKNNVRQIPNNDQLVNKEDEFFYNTVTENHNTAGSQSQLNKNVSKRSHFEDRETIIDILDSDLEISYKVNSNKNANSSFTKSKTLKDGFMNDTGSPYISKNKRSQINSSRAKQDNSNKNLLNHSNVKFCNDVLSQKEDKDLFYFDITGNNSSSSRVESPVTSQHIYGGDTVKNTLVDMLDSDVEISLQEKTSKKNSTEVVNNVSKKPKKKNDTPILERTSGKNNKYRPGNSPDLVKPEQSSFLSPSLLISNELKKKRKMLSQITTASKSEVNHQPPSKKRKLEIEYSSEHSNYIKQGEKLTTKSKKKRLSENMNQEVNFIQHVRAKLQLENSLEATNEYSSKDGNVIKTNQTIPRKSKKKKISKKKNQYNELHTSYDKEHEQLDNSIETTNKKKERVKYEQNESVDITETTLSSHAVTSALGDEEVESTKNKSNGTCTSTEFSFCRTVPDVDKLIKKKKKKHKKEFEDTFNYNIEDDCARSTEVVEDTYQITSNVDKLKKKTKKIKHESFIQSSRDDKISTEDSLLPTYDCLVENEVFQKLKKKKKVNHSKNTETAHESYNEDVETVVKDPSTPITQVGKSFIQSSRDDKISTEDSGMPTDDSCVGSEVLKKLKKKKKVNSPKNTETAHESYNEDVDTIVKNPFRPITQVGKSFIQSSRDDKISTEDSLLPTYDCFVENEVFKKLKKKKKVTHSKNTETAHESYNEEVETVVKDPFRLITQVGKSFIQGSRDDKISTEVNRMPTDDSFVGIKVLKKLKKKKKVNHQKNTETGHESYNETVAKDPSTPITQVDKVFIQSSRDDKITTDDSCLPSDDSFVGIEVLKKLKKKKKVNHPKNTDTTRESYNEDVETIVKEPPTPITQVDKVFIQSSRDDKITTDDSCLPSDNSFVGIEVLKKLKKKKKVNDPKNTETTRGSYNEDVETIVKDHSTQITQVDKSFIKNSRDDQISTDDSHLPSDESFVGIEVLKKLKKKVNHPKKKTKTTHESYNDDVETVVKYHSTPVTRVDKSFIQSSGDDKISTDDSPLPTYDSFVGSEVLKKLKNKKKVNHPKNTETAHESYNETAVNDAFTPITEVDKSFIQSSRDDKVSTDVDDSFLVRSIFTKLKNKKKVNHTKNTEIAHEDLVDNFSDRITDTNNIKRDHSKYTEKSIERSGKGEGNEGIKTKMHGILSEESIEDQSSSKWSVGDLFTDEEEEEMLEITRKSLFNGDDGINDPGGITTSKLAHNSEELDEDEKQQLAQLDIRLPHKEIPPLHLITRASKPTRAETVKNKEYNAKVGRFSKHEDQLIIENWENFCKDHNLSVPPSAFFKFRTSMGINEKIKFLQYLSYRLDDRIPINVHTRFKRIFRDSGFKIGRYTREEDRLIIEYLRGSTSTKPLHELGMILNRCAGSVERRVVLLTNTKNPNRIVWDIKMCERLIKGLLEITGHKKVKYLENASLTMDQWRELSKILDGIPPKKLQRAWWITLHPKLFLDESTNIIRRDLIKMMYANNETDTRTINWKGYAEHFEGVNAKKLNDIFLKILRSSVPKRLSSNLPRTLEYLAETYQGRNWKLKKYTYKNGELKLKQI